MDRSEKVVYLAGFFDGEGHIRISAHSKRCRTFTLQLSCTQATMEPLDVFNEVFGGTVSHRIVPYKTIFKDMWTWQCSSGVAERAIREMMPYFIVKKDEADVALEFRSTFSPQHVKGGHKRMSDALIEKRGAMKELLENIRKAKRPEHLYRGE